MPTKIEVPKHLEFAIVVSERSLDRLVSLAFCLSYFATMGALIALALLTENARTSLLSFVMMPVGAAGLLLLGVAHFFRAPERQMQVQERTCGGIAPLEFMPTVVDEPRAFLAPAIFKMAEQQEVQSL